MVADEIYSQWAASAWRDWEWLSKVSGQSLLTRTGALFLGPAGNAYLRDTYTTLARLDIDAELIEAADIEQRYPQINAHGLGAAVLERGAGVLRARRAVRALVDHLTNDGVEPQTKQIVPFDEQESHCVVRTQDGTTLEADTVVCACGPWLPKLFPQTVGGRIRATRQEVLYFGVPSGDARFGVPHLPVWIDFSAGLYGIPDLDGHGFKVGIDRHGELVDPDALDRVVGESCRDVVARVARDGAFRRWARRRWLMRVSVSTRTRRPATSSSIAIRMWPQCWIVGGGSGHGFKHGPSVGRSRCSARRR